MPRVAANLIARITQRFVLEPFRIQTNRPSILDEKLPVARGEMRHGMPEPDMAMKPKPTRHGVRHSVATIFEFTPANRRHYRVIYY